MVYLWQLSQPGRIGVTLSVFGVPLVCGPLIALGLNSWLWPDFSLTMLFLIETLVGLLCLSLAILRLPECGTDYITLYHPEAPEILVIDLKVAIGLALLTAVAGLLLRDENRPGRR
jgi:hypothetical protein